MLMTEEQSESEAAITKDQRNEKLRIWESKSREQVLLFGQKDEFVIKGNFKSTVKSHLPLF